MTFEQILDAAIELLRRRKRLTLGSLRRQFELDAAGLEDLRQELLIGQRVAREDEDGQVLVWAGDAAPAALSTVSGTRAQAERRQLTIMFCDLADSTALSNTLDVEELRAVLRGFQDAAGAVIARHEGFVNSYMGDGILTFFGYPQAHEDDAQRAVRAGLEIVAAVQALRTLPHVQLRVRVGIATGIVVVGDVIGSGPSREEAVVGSTSNLAARLQSVASPGEVVISAGTLRLLGSGFACEGLEPRLLKGFDEPVPCWRVLREHPVEDSGLARQFGPMVDREIEFPALMEAWRLACTGRGRIVTLRGEAGLGKSRLSEAVREAVAPLDHALLRYFCSNRFQNTALYPVIRQLQHAAGFAEQDTPDQRLDRLERLLLAAQPPSAAAAAMPYLAALLQVPTGNRYAPIGDSPERQREQTLQAMVTHVLEMSRQRPVLILFEDLHWVDPTTQALLEQLARRIESSRVLVLATSRPEFEPPWAELPHAMTMELSLLKRHHRGAIVANHTGGKSFPPEILEHILQKSDGIPLYVEELTKAMMESGLLREEPDRFVLTGPVPSVAVPSTLHDSLLARLDRLSVVKEVAQAGAAIGREFSYRMLSALLKLAPAELNASLGRLADAGLIHARGTPPDASYTFKHALIQDAAYATMLRPKRQGLHARIAQVMEADPVAANRVPELLAHHLTEADQIERAVPYLLDAGLRATASAAHTEACKHFEEGLRLVPLVADAALRRRLELRLRTHLGMALAALRGFAAPEVEAENQRARELCREGGEPDELFWVLRALCALYIVRDNAPASHELAAHCVRLAQETRRPEFMVEACVMEGYAHGYAGDLNRGRDGMARAAQIYRDTPACQWPSTRPPRK